MRHKMVRGVAEEAAEALILWLKRSCYLPRYLIQCANNFIGVEGREDEFV